MRVIPLFLLLLASAAALPAQQTPSPYLRFSEAERKLTELARQHADVLTLETIGSTPGGRKIHAVRIAMKGPVDPARRPAVFVGANIAGFHNAGTQAAIGLMETLLTKKADPALANRTFYIAPMLNPDAQDAMFGPVKMRSSLNGAQLDRDRDGLIAEDGPDDLNGDGRITQMRIADPAGDLIPDPADARVMRRADPLKGEKGQYRVYTEGNDDDGDGQYNEDPAGGFRPDKNFAHAWSDGDPESGPFPSSTPESKAVMDYLLKRRNVAIAFVYGPANNLLEMPRGSGNAPDVGQVRVRPPAFLANQLGLETTREYTVDEIWNLVQGSAFAAQGPGLNRDQLASFLGAGAATAPAAEDLRFYEKLAEDYKKLLDQAGLDNKRPGRQSQTGGLQNWLYYHYGAMAVELDIWGIPKKKAAPAAANAAGNGQALTIDRFEKMSNEEFLALGEEKIAAFLKEIKAPAMVNANMLIEGVRSGRMTPARMAAMMRQQGMSPAPAAAGAGGGALTGDQADLMDYIDTRAKEAFVPWTAVTLKNGKKAEVGGVDPFVEIAPPGEELNKAVAAHTEMILAASARLAQVELLEMSATALSASIWKVTAAGANTGFLPTHTSHGVRTRMWLPVHLRIELPPGASLVSGSNQVAGERLTSGAGVLKGEWLVRAQSGAKLSLTITSQNAGSATKEITLQ